MKQGERGQENVNQTQQEINFTAARSKKEDIQETLHITQIYFKKKGRKIYTLDKLIILSLFISTLCY